MAERRHRRAVGPAGAPAPAEEPRVDPADVEPDRIPDDDERLRADRPPHHDREQ